MKGYGNSLILITQIFSLVQQCMADKSFPESFRNEMKKLDESLTFEKAIASIDSYAQRERIQMP